MEENINDKGVLLAATDYIKKEGIDISYWTETATETANLFVIFKFQWWLGIAPQIRVSSNQL